MAVPSSYNDVTQDQSIRDHIGWVWYDRTFFQQPRGASDQWLFLRFEGVHYYCMVVSIHYYCTHAHAHTMHAYNLWPISITVQTCMTENSIWNTRRYIIEEITNMICGVFKPILYYIIKSQTQGSRYHMTD